MRKRNFSRLWNAAAANQRRISHRINVSVSVLAYISQNETKMKQEIKLATQRLIDSVWTLQYEQIDESTIKILQYDRTTDVGYERERELEQCSLVEEIGRVVTHVRFRPYRNFSTFVTEETMTREMKVINPKYIFSYDNPKTK